MCLCLSRLCQIAKSTLDNSQAHVAKPALSGRQVHIPNCQVHVTKSLTPHRQGNLAKLPNPLHLTDCPKEFQAAHEIKNF
jgi:hypothetical protein